MNRNPLVSSALISDRHRESPRGRLLTMTAWELRELPDSVQFGERAGPLQNQGECSSRKPSAPIDNDHQERK